MNMVSLSANRPSALGVLVVWAIELTSSISVNYWIFRHFGVHLNRSFYCDCRESIVLKDHSGICYVELYKKTNNVFH